MRVKDCLFVGRLLQGDPAAEITDVVYDSRQVAPGALFVALPGRRTDGHEHVGEAVGRGAAALVVERPVQVPAHVAVIQTDSARVALGRLAARFWRYPSRRLRVVGVTGTNGKTTTTHLVKAVLEKHGHRVGLIGTVHTLMPGEARPASLTTPQASDLQRLLHQMVEAGCTYSVMEASSEGLDMNRVDDVEFDLGIFTNLTQDHLDYHGTFGAYREAKARLFRLLSRPGFKPRKAAILNLDDPASEYYRTVAEVPVYTYGLRPGAMVRAEDMDFSPAGTRFRLKTPQGEIAVALRLVGRFNVYNALAAATAGVVEGVDLPVIRDALEAEEGVPGRLQPVRAGQPFGVFVDYAHSPDSLENVLRTARAFTRGRLIAVFGCGGDRDPTKRPIMGRIAAELADHTIITSDNPRSEDPVRIVQQIEAGVLDRLGPGRTYEVVIDRAEAIRRAVAMAQPDDVIVIAGKGHETYQIFKDRTIPFDDRAVARSLIEARAGKGGS
ncbi:UDP-N-acetylmuramyl-tripeptide synthetase [Symbiobacterium terraclitae]|jgi:UDP-N-acetylmuramyl-tripeptide synthetase|uniref:UDP-N-acetylmuramoyl-L-alanyl-D-glutamate--2,6-diaminopimelate ligase n=1 Tax=Symbiobacterium terraclitae TaxID=557451 RepID=A0ABS4JQE0_9FIRM|nr:UDP-N-acetylmuramoyl-L-alanyl-D-glutamate--2,6-diaminopimelate ligase [Symbiobacterium terraclitae]MBP2017160.1 UDP-N-acetylmuramyl-tripeptide synthetase [Symbiobacterium terraclitae]